MARQSELHIDSVSLHEHLFRCRDTLRPLEGGLITSVSCSSTRRRTSRVRSWRHPLELDYPDPGVGVPVSAGCVPQVAEGVARRAKALFMTGRAVPHPAVALRVMFLRRRAVADLPPSIAAVATLSAVVSEETALGLGLVFADVLQPLDTDVGDFQQNAAVSAKHVDAWLPADVARRWDVFQVLR